MLMFVIFLVAIGVLFSRKVAAVVGTSEGSALRPMRFIFLLAAFQTGAAFGQVTVDVSPIFSSIYKAGTVKLRHDALQYVVLPSSPARDSYLVIASAVQGPVAALATDLRNPQPPKALWQRELNSTLTSEVVPWLSEEGAALWFSTSASTAEVSFVVYRYGLRSPDVLKALRNIVSSTIHGVGWAYYLPPITVAVKPCGESSAWSAKSTSNITICSELLSDLVDKHLTEALDPIVLHELAHSLLNTWKLPGYDNEDLADEFVVVWLGKRKQSLDALATWLKQSDPVTEALAQILIGDRHTISVQRVRNMQAALARYEDLQQRWAQALAPYRKPLITVQTSKGVDVLAAPTNLPGWLGGIDGVCRSYTRVGSSRSDNCGSAVMYLNSPQTGRHMLILSTPEKEALTFFGSDVLETVDRYIVLPVDEVVSAKDGKVLSMQAKGQCVYNGEVSATAQLSCSALTGDGERYGIEFSATSPWHFDRLGQPPKPAR
jgi:hypothetical protein